MTARAQSRAFTLVEVLLVLALLALFATVFIPGVNSMLSAMDERGPDQLLAEAVLGARGEALESGRTVELTYDTEKRQFVWGATGSRGPAFADGFAAELLPMESGASILLGGIVTEVQKPLRRVRFFPDGTCDAFRIRLKETGVAVPRLYVVDPWTCALSPVAAKGPS